MPGGGKGIQARDHEFTNSSGSVETGDETGKNSSIEGITEAQMLTELSDKFRGIGQPFLPPG